MINKAIWGAIEAKADHKLSLSDIDSIAKESSADGAEVLSVLALLCRPVSGFLQMTYRNETTPNPEVPITEVMAKLQAD